MGSEENQFLQPQQPPAPRRKRWGGCLGGLSCFRKQKGGKRIVPASRVTESNASNHSNGPRAGGPNQATGINLSLLAPPSSPASFSNSALPSTAQSPSCFLSANSPECPSNTMFVTGPYANETQLVSPPVFSTFTTEPSTAPFTPPPELAYLTTPSSPDVPYARFLSSSVNIKTRNKTGFNSPNDLHSTYLFYPGSPANALRSPVSRTTAETEFEYRNSESGQFIGLQGNGPSKARQDSNFFCLETFARFYQDQSLSHAGGRLSISRETDTYSNGGNGLQIKPIKNCKPDAEELEAYRASFGFSADEIISTAHYAEISDVMEDSFSIAPVASCKPVGEEHILTSQLKGVETEEREAFPSTLYSSLEDQVQQKRAGDLSGRSLPTNNVLNDDDDSIYSKMGSSRIGGKYNYGASNSDAEIEYRRGRSLREGRSINGIYGLT